MSIDLEKIETQTIDADLDQAVDRVRRLYEDLSTAFQKEAIQNSWDARKDRKKGKGWLVKIDCIKDNKKKHIIIEDFGTWGMDKNRWKAFMALWKPFKKHSDVGGQGQGKFVLMGASKKSILVVESRDKKNQYRCRYLRKGKRDKGKKKYSINDFINGALPLKHRGTKVWIYDARDSFINSLHAKEFIQEVAATWWQILSNPFNAKILLFGKEITLPRMPTPIKSKVSLKKKKVGHFGRIKRLVLEFYEKDLPDLFTGVRVQRAQMMIIRIPFEIYDREYKNRFSGYIIFDKERLEPVLKKIEKTDHCGFTWESPWKEIKKLVGEEIEKFRNEVIPQKKEKEVFDQKAINRAIEKANQIIMEYAPSLTKSGGDTTIPPIEPSLPPLLRINNLNVNKKQIKYNEPVQPQCTIKNETLKPEKVLLQVELKYHTGTRINKEEYMSRVKSKRVIHHILSMIKLDKSHQKGKYTIRATLSKNRHDIHTKATSFYLETERMPYKKGFVKGLYPVRLEDNTVRNYPIRNGVIKWNTSHPDFRNIWENFKHKKRFRRQQIVYYWIKIAIDEAIRELLKLQFSESREVDIDKQINELMDKRDKMYYEIYI